MAGRIDYQISIKVFFEMIITVNCLKQCLNVEHSNIQVLLGK